MASTQEEAPREKEGCIPKAQDSIRCGLYLHRAQIGQKTQMEPMENERRSPWRHRRSQHQGLRLFWAMQRTDGWSICGQGSARRRRLCHPWMRLPWAHGSACWCRRLGQRCVKPQWRDVRARRASAAGAAQPRRRWLYPRAQTVSPTQATSVQDKTPQEDVGCAASCSASGQKLCLYEPRALGGDTGWVCAEPDLGCPGQGGAAPEEAASAQNETLCPG